MRSDRGFFQNFLMWSSGRTRFSNASKTPGYRKNEVSCVSRDSSNCWKSKLVFLMARRRWMPRAWPLRTMCSRTRVEKNRSRDSSNRMLVRSSISMRISLNSCSFRLTWPPWRSPSFSIQFTALCTTSDCRLAKGAHWHWVPVGFLCCLAGLLGRGAELRERFVELIRKFDELADGGDRAARSLRRLAGDVGNDLHRVSDTFRSTYLLFGSEGNFLNEFGGLTNDARNRIECASGLIGKRCAGFHFLGAFFHDNDRFVRLGLDGLDEGRDVFGCAVGVFGELAYFVSDDGETAASFTGASCFNGGVQCEQVGLLSDVVDDVDDFRNFKRAVAKRLDFFRGGLHGSANALHAVEGVADGTVALFSSVKSAPRSFGAGLGVVRNLFHRDGKLFDGARRVRDFLILLRCAGLHFVGSDENVVGASGDFHGSLADALENFSEVVEHVVDGVRDVAEGIVGDFAAKREFAARDLVDDREELRDAALQRLAGFLVGIGFRNFRDGAIQVLRNIAKFVIRLNVCTCASITRRETFREFGELLDRRDDSAAQAPGQKPTDRERQQHREDDTAT